MVVSIHAVVTYPNMTLVDVDIAHRSKEILVRFSVEDQEVGNFILEQLENLASLLREQGFEKAELVANVNKELRSQDQTADSHDGNASNQRSAGVKISSSTSIIV